MVCRLQAPARCASAQIWGFSIEGVRFAGTRVLDTMKLHKLHTLNPKP